MGLTARLGAANSGSFTGQPLLSKEMWSGPDCTRGDRIVGVGDDEECGLGLRHGAKQWGADYEPGVGVLQVCVELLDMTNTLARKSEEPGGWSGAMQLLVPLVLGTV